MIQVSNARPELLIPDEPDGHVWVMIAEFKLSDAEIRGHVEAGTEIEIATERMAWAQVGCVICEQPWSRERSGAPCPGPRAFPTGPPEGDSP